MSPSSSDDPLLDQLSLEECAAQLVIAGLDLMNLGPTPRTPDETFAQANELATVVGVGGFISFGGDADTKPRLAALKRASRPPWNIRPLIACDLERGLGEEVKCATELPPFMALGATADEELARAAGRLAAREARQFGIDWVLSPVFDLGDLPQNPKVQAKAFASEPALVIRMASAWALGVEDEGLIACAKHFPGHGGTAEDSHDGAARVHRSKATLEARDFLPFRAAIDIGIGSIMTAHVIYPALGGNAPATIDRAIVTGILRETLRYEGLIVSDALLMAGLTSSTGGDEARAAVLALEAGVDVLLLPRYPAAVVAAVCAWAKAGDASRARLRDAASRVLAVKRRRGMIGETSADDGQVLPFVRDPDGDRLAQSIADASLVRVGRQNAPPTKDEKVLVLVLDDDALPDGGGVFVRELKQSIDGVTMFTLEREATDLETAHARALASAADRVVVAVICQTRGWKGRSGLGDVHRTFLRSLDDLDRPSTIVALASPWVLEGLCPRASDVILAWGDVDACQRAAARGLLGQDAPGKVPVDPLDMFTSA